VAVVLPPELVARQGGELLADDRVDEIAIVPDPRPRHQASWLSGRRDLGSQKAKIAS
jgi:hypothetical protein